MQQPSSARPRYRHSRRTREKIAAGQKRFHERAREALALHDRLATTGIITATSPAPKPRGGR